MNEAAGQSAPAQDSRAPGGGFPPVAVMQRMLDLQEKRLELDAREIDVNERELDSNRALGLKSLELNAKANTEYNQVMSRAIKWRYVFWIVACGLATGVTITAFLLDKEAFVVEAIKYAALFAGGYGTKSAIESSRKKNIRPHEGSD